MNDLYDPQDERLCIDCRHFRAPRCMRKTTTKRCPSGGNTIHVGPRPQALVEREDGGCERCGPEGRFWEARA